MCVCVRACVRVRVCVSALTAWWDARNKNRVHPVNDSNAKDSHYGD